MTVSNYIYSFIILILIIIILYLYTKKKPSKPNINYLLIRRLMFIRKSFKLVGPLTVERHYNDLLYINNNLENFIILSRDRNLVSDLSINPNITAITEFSDIDDSDENKYIMALYKFLNLLDITIELIRYNDPINGKLLNKKIDINFMEKLCKRMCINHR